MYRRVIHWVDPQDECSPTMAIHSFYQEEDRLAHANVHAYAHALFFSLHYLLKSNQGKEDLLGL